MEKKPLSQILWGFKLLPQNVGLSKPYSKNGFACESMEEADDMYRKIIIKQTASDGRRDLRQKDRPVQSEPLIVEPVKVDGVVMDYIGKIKSKELDIIRKRNGVSIKQNDRYVTFMPQNIQAQFAREQFITLYQKIATGLQTKTYVNDPRTTALCQAEFPDLVISGKDERRVQLTGNFISLERFERVLNEITQPRRYSQHQSPNKTHDYNTPYNQSVKQQKSVDQAKEETCPICLEPLKASNCKALSKCKHTFCEDCLKRAFQLKPACPICGEIYGELTGTQPKGGTMTITRDHSSLPGYERHGTIVITYYIPSGYQGDEHPNPGMQFHGASRIAYLPDTQEGNKVLKLLDRAFKQRLTFTIGSSSTTGQNNVVTWNDIHHKTSRSGGPTHYGYPDPDYLNRVQDELKAKGIY
ncbi:uncharacterized protein [Garra rufa]|uniref:uncharacterized protein n=1 Tax=Garra rufa TaxID=137080 RepID=UPI003CCEDACA